MPPAALRGRLCGGHQGAAPPGPPKCTALFAFRCCCLHSNCFFTNFVNILFERLAQRKYAINAVRIGGPPEALNIRQMKSKGKLFDRLYQRGGYHHHRMDQAFQRFYWRRQKIFSQLFNPFLTGKTLDIGCGEGELSRFLVSQQMILSDISLLALKKASQYGDRAAASDILQLPFKENSFDRVVFTEAIYHIPQPQKALEEIYRVLKPGGLCLFTAGVRDSLSIRYREAVDRLTAKKDLHNHQQDENLFQEFYSKRAIKRFFKSNRFKIKRRFPYLFEFKPLYQDRFYDFLVTLGFLFPLFSRYIVLIAQKEFTQEA